MAKKIEQSLTAFMQTLEQAKATVWLSENKDLIKKFAFHFQSQAKPHSEKLSKATAKQYAQDAWNVLEALERVIR